ncbi:MAG: homocysteine S-methyltransferase family protein [Chloroflexota bacterium]
MRLEKMRQRLQAGEKILIDGATGTELERRGVPMVEGGWNAGGVLTHPEVVQQVHEDYIRMGAQIIISNTFSTGMFWLRRAGMEDHFEFLNRQGVEIAKAARDKMERPDVLIAGGMFITPREREAGVEPSVSQQNLKRQAQIFADAGADFIMLEMMRDIEITRWAIQAAQQAGLPVWVGFSCRLDGDGKPNMLHGEVPLADYVKAIREEPIEALLVMHTLTEDIDACLDVLQPLWSGPVGVYAHSGKFNPPNWQFIDMITPEDYAAAAAGWLKRGVQVVGGCCGIGPEHLDALRRVVDAA